MILRMGASGYNGVIAPLLPAMVDSLHFSLAVTVQLAGVTAVAWAIGSLVLAPLGDRYGAKPLIVWGSLAMAIFAVLTALTSNYLLLLAVRFLGGVAGGAVGPASQAYVLDSFRGRARSTALGWVTAGYAMGGMIMVPLLVVLTSVSSWRWAFIAIGLFFLTMSVLHSNTLQRGQPPNLPIQRSSYTGMLTIAIRNSQARPSLIANLLERSAYSAVATYLPLILVTRFRIPLVEIAPILSAFSMASVVGGVLGGHLLTMFDKVQSARTVYTFGMVLAAPLAFATFAVTHGVAIILATSILFSGIDALVRPTYLRLLSAACPQSGSAMAWNAVGNQMGTGVGTSTPPLLFPTFGLGVLSIWGIGFALAAGMAMIFPWRSSSRVP